MQTENNRNLDGIYYCYKQSGCDKIEIRNEIRKEVYMDKLRKANTYIEENRISREELPVFHVTPPCGWMNDPNGFSAYQGKVHLFYQFHPYSEI